MMIDFYTALKIMLFACLIVLVIILIILGIKLIKTLKKVDGVIDDVNTKISSVDGLFNIIDKTTDYASLISDKLLGALYGLVSVFMKKKKGNDLNEEK